MWLVLAPRIRPDVHVWPGRRLVSAVDALGWPAGIAIWIAEVPVETGIVGTVGMACCGMFALPRLARAVFANERYRLTSVWVGKLLGASIAVGAALKLLQIVGAS